MSYNGSGVFTANSTGLPVVTGTTISSVMFNAFTADVATGLSTAVCKDGQQTCTQRVPFADGISLFGVNLDASGGSAQVGFIQAGAGAVSRTASAKMRERVSIADFGGSAGATAEDNAAAVLAAAVYLTAAPLNGGVINAPAGIYAVAADTVVLGQNVIIEGDSDAAAYDGTNYSGGTVFNFAGSGSVGIRIANRSGGLRNIRLDGTGGSVNYGVLMSGDGGVASVLENVSSSNFEYGFALANLNSAKLSNLCAYSNTKVGCIVLARKSSAPYGAAAYPLIAAYVTSTPSTVFELDITARSNRIGVALLDGYCPKVNGTIESNTNYGLLVFKTEDGTCDGHSFGVTGRLHMENNASDTGVWNITDIEAFSNAGGDILYGNHSGAWTNAEPHAGIWVGSADEDVVEDETQGPSCNIEFGPNANISSKGSLFRFRSANKPWVNRCKPGSATSPTAFSLTQYCVGLEIDEPWGVLVDEIQTYRVTGGTRTIWNVQETFVKGTINAAVSGTWYNAASTNNGTSYDVNAVLMTPDNKYEYVISPSGQYAQYGAHGVFYYDGTDVSIEKEKTGAGCDVQIDPVTHILQYKQNSGIAIASVSFKVRPIGGVSY